MLCCLTVYLGCITEFAYSYLTDTHTLSYSNDVIGSVLVQIDTSRLFLTFFTIYNEKQHFYEIIECF